MDSKDIIRTAATTSAPPVTPAAYSASMVELAEVNEELDDIVGRSRRRSGWRRALSRVGAMLSDRLERLVPPSPPDDPDPGLQIKFPFF
jgi:hypothetical protein